MAVYANFLDSIAVILIKNGQYLVFQSGDSIYTKIRLLYDGNFPKNQQLYGILKPRKPPTP